MKKSAFNWIVKKAGNLTLLNIILTVVMAAVSALAVSFSLVSKDVIDIATGAGAGDMTKNVILLVFMIILMIILQVAASRINIAVTGKMEMKLKGSIFEKLLRKDISSVYKYHTGDIMNRLTNDVNAVSIGYSSVIPEIVSFAVRIVFSICVLIKLDRSFALIYIVAAPLFLIFAKIYSNKMKFLHKRVQETEGNTRSYMTESLQNLLVIKAFGKERVFSLTADGFQKENYKAKLKRNTVSITVNILVYMAFTFGYYFALCWGAAKIRSGVLTFGALTAMLQLVGQVQSPIKGIADMLPRIFSMTASAERLVEFEELDDDVDKEKLPDCNRLYNQAEKIVFKNVSFSYDKENPVITDFNYEINKGEFVAIFGLSGIGKSTLLKLLLGVIKPQEGNIFLEGEKVCDINKYTRGLFAYVPQGNMVISGSIKENIRFYNDKATDEEINNAARIAQMEGFLSELPDGIDTIIGEKGIGLSEGQIQRIAIARALLSDCPVLLLDEATSALDEKTESDFLKAIKELKTKTCIIVSHKQAAKDICDKIINIK